RMRWASTTCWPRISSTTRRILRAEVRLYRLVARASGMISEPSVRRGRATGTCGSARTRRACDRPSPQRRTPARACAHRARRSCGRSCRARSWSDATTCARPSSRCACSCLRPSSSDGRRQTGPSSPNEASATPLPATANDVLVRRLVLLACAALGLAPRGTRVPTTGGLAFAATQRVIDRVHRDAADRRALALPSGTPRLAELDELVLGVAHGAHGGLAGGGHEPGLSGGKPEGGHRALLGHELHARARRACHLGAGARLQLDRVHDRADRDVAQRQRVAGADLGVGPREQSVALAHAVGRDDVALLAVDVVEQGDPRGAVRVVLDVGDLRGHAVLVAAEVDHSVPALGTPALVPSRDATVHVATRLVATLGDQRLLGAVAGELV